MRGREQGHKELTLGPLQRTRHEMSLVLLHDEGVEQFLLAVAWP